MTQHPQRPWLATVLLVGLLLLVALVAVPILLLTMG